MAVGPSAPFFPLLWVGRHRQELGTWNDLMVLGPVMPAGRLFRLSVQSNSRFCPHSPPRLAGFKSRRANKPQTGLTLNYPHEWRANPIFIFTWPWNALCDLYGTDLPGCFRFAWMSSDNDFQYAHRLLVKPASQPQSGVEGKSIWVENLTELTHR